MFRRKRNRKPALLKQLELLESSGLGRPSKCMFGDELPTFVIYCEKDQAFLCHEHIGDFFSTWTTEREMSVVRL